MKPALIRFKEGPRLQAGIRNIHPAGMDQWQFILRSQRLTDHAINFNSQLLCWVFNEPQHKSSLCSSCAGRNHIRFTQNKEYIPVPRDYSEPLINCILTCNSIPPHQTIFHLAGLIAKYTTLLPQSWQIP